MNEVFTLVTFGLTIIGTLISCGAAVISVSSAKRPASVQLQSDVDELVALVDKMMKEQRKERMSRVRNASKDSGSPQPDIGGTESNLSAHPAIAGKAALRQLARQKGLTQ